MFLNILEYEIDPITGKKVRKKKPNDNPEEDLYEYVSRSALFNIRITGISENLQAKYIMEVIN